MEHSSYIKNTYYFVDKLTKLVIPGECLLITVYGESMYTNINHAKGLQCNSMNYHYNITIFPSMGNDIFRLMAFQWSGIGHLILQTYTWTLFR